VLDRPAPVVDAAWHGLADGLRHHDRLVLAVSGGPDSMAMLTGLAALAAFQDELPPMMVATVDHGLRAQSADEATLVEQACHALGLEHHTLKLGPQPTGTNLQAWARAERYRALGALAGEGGAVLTAHTAEDQAETFLMRAARGTGSEGLAGIREQSEIAGVKVVRPFLNWTRAQLHKALAACPVAPVEDPSNGDDRFTRVRFRRWLADAPLPDSNRAVAEGLAESARIAALEGDALERLAGRLVDDLAGQATDGASGYLAGSLSLADQPLALQARMLRRLLHHVGRGQDAAGRFDLARMIEIAERMMREDRGTCVVGGARLEWIRQGEAHRLLAFAEAGRAGFPVLRLAPQSGGVWDGRFEIANDCDQTVIVRGWTRGDALPWGAATADNLPARVLASLPVAVPAADAEGAAWAPMEGVKTSFRAGRA
jgi:tRNA(Ile)-lysidine synthase